VKSWCISQITATYLARMEAIVSLYQHPYDPRHPQVCFDEKSYQLLAHTRPPLPMQPGQVQRQDYEYKREGTRNLFVFVEPLAGFRHVLVTQRRTKADCAKALPYLVDVLYPDAAWIDLVLDNLNTHTYGAVVETFGKAEADRIWSRLRLHYTPYHASWLNMAEIEIGILSRQCLRRRLSHEQTLATEILAWEQWRNTQQAKINWSFTIQDMRRVFAEHYSDPLTC
jgi:hypothetical protein